MTNSRSVTNMSMSRTQRTSFRSQTQLTSGGENNTPPTIDKEDEENITDFFEEEQGPITILHDKYERLAAVSPQV
jgi:hypothetical protein